MAAFALGSFVTVAAHGATAQDGEPRALTAFGIEDPAVKPYLSPKMLKAVPVGPGAVSKPVQKVLTSPAVTTALDASGIPEVALEAYQRAAAHLAVTDQACHLPWQLLAAIGRVESDDGLFGGAMLLANGNETRPIYGITLDGQDGVALVRDTDHGKLDADPYFDRAVGPMQFLPATWEEYGADGNGDGVKDPQNIFDAALAAAGYLCAGGGNMTNPAQEAAAVLRYNDADEYVRVVLALAASYEDGNAAVVPASGSAGSADNGGTSAPARPSSPPAGTPAPSITPNQSATPSPSRTPATEPAAPASPAPSASTPAGPAPSDQPSQTPAPSATRSIRPGQTADIGWAPAMRQVVVKLLNAPRTAANQPAGPTQPAPRSAAAPTVVTVCAAPATPGSCATDMMTRPVEMQVSGDGSAVLKNITWTDWGSPTAYGTGTLDASNCKPGCAEGTSAGYQATVTISGISPYGQGTAAYSLVTVQAPGLPFNMSFTGGLVP